MDKWTDRLSEYVDGELALQEAEALEAHLLECAECGQTLQQLRAVVARAGQVLDAPPTNDLWSGIAARIETEQSPKLSSSHTRKLSLSITQLMAASIVLMLLSAGSVYLMMMRNTGAPVATAARQTRSDVRQVADKPVLENYNFAISELEDALKSNRSQLDTATIRVLETNLHTIDKAILDARAALAHDPGNTYLNRYLDETVQKKIQLLRRATSIRAET